MEPLVVMAILAVLFVLSLILLIAAAFTIHHLQKANAAFLDLLDHMRQDCNTLTETLVRQSGSPISFEPRPLVKRAPSVWWGRRKGVSNG